VCDTVREMIEAVEKVGRLDRAACRHHVERHFSAQAMADGYERAYAQVLARRGARGGAPPSGLSRASGVQVAGVPRAAGEPPAAR
jgi:hypothetical protein